jgi:hypothetical protein
MEDGTLSAVVLKDYCRTEGFDSRIDSLLYNEVVEWIGNIGRTRTRGPPQCMIRRFGPNHRRGAVPRDVLTLPFTLPSGGALLDIIIVALLTKDIKM